MGKIIKSAPKPHSPNFSGPTVKVSDILPNQSNPRIIRDTKFKRLVESIKDFPKMMQLRPITLDSREIPMILAGNMRYQAIKAAGYKEIPIDWIQFADDLALTEEEKRRYIVQDNQSAGEWDYDGLANEFTAEELDAWGLDMPYIDPQDGEPGTPGKDGGFILGTSIGDIYHCAVGDDPATQIGYTISAPKLMNGTQPADDTAQKAFNGLFKEIDKSLERFAKTCKKAGLTFVIRKNNDDITTKF